MGRPTEYPLEFRREAAQLVLTSDRSMADIARELGVHHKTLGSWVSDERRRRAHAADVGSRAWPGSLAQLGLSRS